MLELKNIKKDYPAGNETVHALKGISRSSGKTNLSQFWVPPDAAKPRC